MRQQSLADNSFGIFRKQTCKELVYLSVKQGDNPISRACRQQETVQLMVANLTKNGYLSVIRTLSLIAGMKRFCIALIIMPFARESWHTWLSEASAEAIPGALDFVQYARKKGVTVFYISNRAYRGPLDRNANGQFDPGEEQVDLKPFTIANLVRVGFLPQKTISNDDAVRIKLDRLDTWR
jgi:hypothetical protein